MARSGAELLLDNGWPKSGSVSDNWPPAIDEDSIRVFTVGSGDVNPRWTDGLVAPPLFAVCSLGTLGQLTPGSVPRWRRIAVELVGELEGPEQLSGTVGVQAALDAASGDGNSDDVRVDVELTRSDGSTCATATIVVGRSGGPTSGREPANYDPSVIATVERSLLQEQFGPSVLSGLDHGGAVDVPPIVRGPYNVFDAVYYFAGSAFRWRCGQTWREAERAYFEDDVAEQHGFPLPVCPSGLQAAWSTPVLTNVLGDEWSVERLELDFLSPILTGDVVRTTGRLSRSDDGSKVTGEFSAANQQGVQVTRGRAEIGRRIGGGNG